MNNFQRNLDPLVSMKLGDPWKDIQEFSPVRIKRDFSVSFKTNKIRSYSRDPMKFRKDSIFYIKNIFIYWSYKPMLHNCLEIPGEFSIGLGNSPDNSIRQNVKADLKKFKDYIEILDK